MANTYLSRNQTGNTYTRTWTLSWWFKRSKLGTTQRMWTSDDDASGNNDDFFQWQSDDTIVFGFYASGYYAKMHTNRKFRDTNAWYHCVFAWDSTQTTASDRIKVYINGVQETSWLASDYPNQNSNSFIGGWSSNLYPIECGRRGLDNTQHFDGSMSHCHFTDGTAYDASAFGETDATTGEWKIKTSVNVNYGTNGFFILKDGNSVTDQSGEGNNFTVGGGTLTKTEDSPSNVFATANPNDVMKQSGGIYKPTFSNGNLTLSSSAGNNYQTFGTLAVDTGKYYWETKATDCDGHRVGVFFGNNKVHSGSYYFGANAFYIHQNGQIYYNGSNTVYMSSLSDGDIVGVALDRTNGHIYLHKNGQYADGNGNNDQTFANAVSISTKLGVTMPSDITYPFFDVYGTAIMDINFGNGYFGTTAVTTNSGNGYAGAEGKSIFNYQPPTGYSALSTLGLNE